MVDVERHAFGAAIDALPAELLKKVFAHLILKERALLILDPRDLRVLELCESNFTNSVAMPLTGRYRHILLTNERVVSTRCRREGGSHPLGLTRFRKRGDRQRKFCDLRRRRNALRALSASRMAPPRCLMTKNASA